MDMISIRFEGAMRKRKPRITRLGLPEKSERIIIAVTEAQKDSIKKAAVDRGTTVSRYLLTLHEKR